MIVFLRNDQRREIVKIENPFVIDGKLFSFIEATRMYSISVDTDTQIESEVVVGESQYKLLPGVTKEDLETSILEQKQSIIARNQKEVLELDTILESVSGTKP